MKRFFYWFSKQRLTSARFTIKLFVFFFNFFSFYRSQVCLFFFWFRIDSVITFNYTAHIFDKKKRRKNAFRKEKLVVLLLVIPCFKWLNICLFYHHWSFEFIWFCANDLVRNCLAHFNIYSYGWLVEIQCFRCFVVHCS